MTVRLNLYLHRASSTASFGDHWVEGEKGRSRFGGCHMGFRSPFLSLPPNLLLLFWFRLLAWYCFSLRVDHRTPPPHLSRCSVHPLFPLPARAPSRPLSICFSLLSPSLRPETFPLPSAANLLLSLMARAIMRRPGCAPDMGRVATQRALKARVGNALRRVRGALGRARVSLRVRRERLVGALGRAGGALGAHWGALEAPWGALGVAQESGATRRLP